MKTIKWYHVGIPIDTEELFSRIQDFSYSIEKSKGFIIEEKRRNYIVARYVEKKIMTKEIISPFGEIETIEFTDFLVIDFQLSFNTKWILEVYNKPRTIKPLTIQFSHLIGYGFYIEEIKLDLMQLVQKMEMEIAKLSIVKMEIFNINIQNQALGQMLITSNKDVRPTLKSHLLNQTGYSINYFKAYFLDHEHYTGCLELYSTGRLELQDMPIQAFLVEYRKVLLHFI